METGSNVREANGLYCETGCLQILQYLENKFNFINLKYV